MGEKCSKDSLSPGGMAIIRRWTHFNDDGLVYTGSVVTTCVPIIL